MKRGLGILCSLGVCLAALGAILLWPRESQPVYQGRTLSEWGDGRVTGSTGEGIAANAIRHLGTNALPLLVQWLEYEPPKWREPFQGILIKIPIIAIPRKLWEGDRMLNVALWAFPILGSETNAATRQVTLLTLINLVEKGRAESRTAAKCIEGIYIKGVDISPAMPALLLLDREARKRRRAAPYEDLADALPELARNPDYFVASLGGCLQNSNAYVRLEAVRAINHYATHAERAVVASLFRAVLDDPAPQVRKAAARTLRKINLRAWEEFESR